MEIKEPYPRTFIVIIENDEDLGRFNEFKGKGHIETPKKEKKTLPTKIQESPEPHTEDYTPPYPDVPFEKPEEKTVESIKPIQTCGKCGAQGKTFPIENHRKEKEYLCYECGLDEVELKRKMNGVIEKETPEELIEFLLDNAGKKFSKSQLRENLNIPHRKLQENLSFLMATGKIMSDGTISMKGTSFWVNESALQK